MLLAYPTGRLHGPEITGRLGRVVWLWLLLLLVAPAVAQATNPVYVFSHLAGSAGGGGNADGTGAEARFGEPRGVAVDSAGNVFVADRINHTIRKITTSGVVTTFAGFNGQSGTTDGQGAMARFTNPQGLAIDGADNLYVIGGLIRKITPAGVVTTLAGTESGGGSAVAIDGAGNFYIAEQLTIRKIAATGEITLFGNASEAGSADGTAAIARFFQPRGVAVDGAGNVYVADGSNHTIRKITSFHPKKPGQLGHRMVLLVPGFSFLAEWLVV